MEKDDLHEPTGVIDIGNEENFKYCYVLFQWLFAHFFSDVELKDKSGKATFKQFLDRESSTSFSGFSKKIAVKSFAEVNGSFRDLEDRDRKHLRIAESSIEQIVKKLSGDSLIHSSKIEENHFLKIKLDALCRLLPKRQSRKDKLEIKTWSELLADTEATETIENIPRSHLANHTLIGNSSKPKILMSFSVSDVFSGQLKTSILNNFRFRFSQMLLRDEINLEFDPIEEEIRDRADAKVRAKRSRADLIVWGHFGNEHDHLAAKLEYEIIAPHLKKRISRISHSYEEMKIYLKDLRTGKIIYREVDQAIFLILGIGALAKNKLELALSFLNEIPDNNRCDETCFILGNCRYLAGEYTEGLELWREAAERNQKHLRAKINLTRHELSIKRRKGESLTGKTLREAKERLADYDPQDASIEESALIGVLFAELGEKEMAIKALEAALKGKKKLEEASYYHIRLGQLKNDPREYAKAALATEHLAIHKLCIRLITNSGLSEEEKVKLRAKIRENVRSNPELRPLYSENGGFIKEDDLTKTTDFTVYDISGLLRKHETKDLVKNGDGLNYDDWVFAEKKAVKAVLLKWNRHGGDFVPRRLYLPKPNVPTKIEESIYEYAESLRSSNSDDEILLLCLRELKLSKRVESKMVKLVCQEIGLNLSLVYDKVGRLLLDRRMLDPFSEQMAGKLTTIEIQQDTGDFTTIQKLRVLIPDDVEVMDRVDKFSELIDYSDDKYYSKLATYLSDFYASADETDIRLWSVVRHLS
jgi:tetratricopeptide (TPR) repeat protein